MVYKLLTYLIFDLYGAEHMQITTNAATLVNTAPLKSGNKLPTETSSSYNRYQDMPLTRIIAEKFDPENMSYNDSRDLANELMLNGEGKLSIAFVPPPTLENNTYQSSQSNTTFDQNMDIKFNMIENLKSRIEFNKDSNLSTTLLEDSLTFLEKVKTARNTTSIDTYT